MNKNLLRKSAIILLIAILAFTSLIAYQERTGNAEAFDIPRMLGLEGAEEEVIRLDGPPTTGIEGPFVEVSDPPVSMDMDLRSLPQTGPETKQLAREMGKYPSIDDSSGPDPLIQTDGGVGNRPFAEPLAAAPSPLMSFKGLDYNAWGAGHPPDTHGDVGPTHYIQAVNTSIGIFSKATGVRLAAFTFNSFFSANGASGVCATGNQGDPYVLYDQVSGRWIITDFAWSNIMSGPYYECIAVSKTADPVSGGWWLYSFVAETGTNPPAKLNDYPKLGIWGDGIYMSANLFDCLTSNCSSASYGGVKVWALNRSDMISGAALRSVAFKLGTSYFSLLPANLKGDLPPANTPEYFMSGSSSNTSMQLWKFSTNLATPASSTFTGPTTFSVASFTAPSGGVPQPPVPLKNIGTLDSLGDRLMSSLQYRNIGGVQSLWVSRTVVAGTSTGVRWTEVRNMSTTPTVFQQGTYAPDATYRWMPSLAVDKSGNMAIGYSVSSATVFPSIRYAGRLVNDPLNTLGQTETSLVAGTGSQTSGRGARWGDYASMSVDPVDDCTFWFTSEYYEVTGTNWQTRIGSFKFPSCGGVVGPTATPGPTNTPSPTYTPTPTVTPGGSTNVIVNPGFESGPGAPWTEYSSGGYEIIDTSRPHAGSYSAYECDYNSCTEYIQQTITVPANASLTFWWYMTSSDSLSIARDSLKVQVYSTGGTLLGTLRTRTNISTRNTWSLDTISLSAYAGQTVKLRFITTTNFAYKTAFWIDDVSVK